MFVWVLAGGRIFVTSIVDSAIDREFDFSYYEIHTALLKIFLIDSHAILILEGYILGNQEMIFGIVFLYTVRWP
jgi:hypothetical protein